MSTQEDTQAQERVGGAVPAEDGLLDALGRQWGAAPWYVSSFFIHMVILAVVLLLTPAPKPKVLTGLDVVTQMDLPVEDDTVAVIPEDRPVETPDNDTKPQIDVSTKIDIPISSVSPVMAPEEAPADTPVSDTIAFSEPDDTMTVTAEGPSGKRPLGGNKIGKVRTPEQIDTITKENNIDKETLKAIERGLFWLAKAQEQDGHWDTIRYEGRGNDIAVTALAELAFLSMGHSTISGKYRKNVRMAQNWLLAKRDAQSGRIGAYRYEAAITMMAMAEAWALGGDKRLAEVVQGQVNDAQKCQNANGGWGYTPESDAIKAHVDTSVAGWWMMGMKSAKVAGAEVSEQSWDKARSYFRSVTQVNKDQTTTSGYVGRGDAVNMTAVGLTCLQFLGLPREDALVKGQADFFMKHPEHMINPKSQISNPYYGWYYQAMGFFQMGSKSPYWKKLGPQLQAVLVSLQEKGGNDAGSWPMQLPWQQKTSHFEEQVGRVGTTALACLTLTPFRFGYAEGHK